MTFDRLRRHGIACSDLGSEIVILNLETSFYFAASASAAVLVNALIEERRRPTSWTGCSRTTR